MTESLLKTGKHTVTSITRSGSENKLPDGVKVAPVDYEDESTLVDAFKGQQFLIVCLSVMVPPGTHKKLVTAAAKAGVPWVMPNCYSGDFTNESLNRDNVHSASTMAAINDVEEAGVSSWIGMACSFWYEFSLAMGPPWYGFDFTNKKVTFYDDGKTFINTSTWEQCGKAAAGLLSLKELPEDENDTSPSISQWRNKPLFISSFLTSQREMLDSVNRVMGRTDKDWAIEYEASDARYKRGMEQLKAGDRMGFAIALYSRAFYPNGDGNYEEKHGLANEALGLPKEDFDEATKRAVAMVESGFGPFNQK